MNDIELKNKEFDEQPEVNLEPELEEKKSKANKIRSAMKYLTDNYKFRYNVVTTQVELTEKGTDKYKMFDDRQSKYILANMRLLGYEIPKEDYYILIEGLLSEDFDPFMDFLSKLPKWSKDEPDYIKRCFDQIKLPDESRRSYLEENFRKWFVALVGCMIDPEIVNHTCLILMGGQGKFKTTFLEGLVPKDMRSKYLYSSTFNTDNKDHEIKMGQVMILNLEELVTFNRNDIEGIKARVTQKEIVVRKAYDRKETQLFKRASFCGSINRKEFLTDLTGSRRWLVVEVADIKLDPELDVRLVYSQAYSLLKSGFQFWFDRDEVNVVEALNEDYQERPFEWELIRRHYVAPEEGNEVGVEYMTATEIMNELADKYNKINANNTVRRTIGMSLADQGFKQVSKRKGTNTPYKYWRISRVHEPNKIMLNESGLDEIKGERDFLI